MKKAKTWFGIGVFGTAFIAAVLFATGGCNKASDPPTKNTVERKVVAKFGYSTTVYSFTTDDGTFYLAECVDGHGTHISLAKVK